MIVHTWSRSLWLLQRARALQKIEKYLQLFATHCTSDCRFAASLNGPYIKAVGCWISSYVLTSLDFPSNLSQISFGIRLGPFSWPIWWYCCCCGVGVVSRPRTTRGPAGGAPCVGDAPDDDPDPSLWFLVCPNPVFRLSMDSRGWIFGRGSSFSRKPVAQNISLWISLKRFKNFKILLNSVFQGSDCGSDGSVVASNTRGPQWESRHRQNLIINIFTVNCWRDENKEKRGREWPIFKIVPFNNTKSIGIKSLTETSSCKGNNNPSKIYIN